MFGHLKADMAANIRLFTHPEDMDSISIHFEMCHRPQGESKNPAFSISF